MFLQLFYLCDICDKVRQFLAHYAPVMHLMFTVCVTTVIHPTLD
jgi:hypothetical protein